MEGWGARLEEKDHWFEQCWLGGTATVRTTLHGSSTRPGLFAKLVICIELFRWEKCGHTKMAGPVRINDGMKLHCLGPMESSGDLYTLCPWGLPQPRHSETGTMIPTLMVRKMKLWESVAFSRVMALVSGRNSTKGQVSWFEACVTEVRC